MGMGGDVVTRTIWSCIDPMHCSLAEERLPLIGDPLHLE